jgi:diadenosine tetraphosphate (Ap4A) HIT family hydrolase
MQPTRLDPSSCLICERIAQITQGTNPYFVAELTTGYVVLGDYQFFRGYTLFLCKHHVSELHELPADVRLTYLHEMSLVAEAVFRCFQPRKLNYELLGNTEPHLHWHLFARHADDPSPGTTSWKVDKALRYGEAARPSPEELATMKDQLLQELHGDALRKG